MAARRIRRSSDAFLLALALTGAMTAAAAQEVRGGPPGQFEYYVLALSWSSGFCETTGDLQHRTQCAEGSGIGFTVHGLWPQSSGSYPVECAPAARSPSRLAIARAQGLFPDEGLARYEWRKHGTCSGRSPSDYFDDVRQARDRVVIPPPLQAPKERQRWTPIDLKRVLVAANPGLRADMIGIACRRGVLEEIRICLSRDLRGFQTCPEVANRGCRGGELSVPAVR